MKHIYRIFSVGFVAFMSVVLVFGSVTPALAIDPVVTYQATGVTESSATLRGYINPDNDGSVARFFRYGTNDNNLSSMASTNSGSTGLFQKTVSNLTDGTTYFYKACTSDNGAEFCGEIFSFQTINTNNGDGNGDNNGNDGNGNPDVVTYAAISITDSSAIIRGYVNSWVGTSYRYFEWGTSSNNLSSTANVGNGGYGLFSKTLTGLESGTTYFYKACIDDGADQCEEVFSFTTDGEEGGNDNGYDVPNVTTNDASSIDEDSAVLNGYISGSNLGTLDRYFMWGFSSGSLPFSLNDSDGGAGSFAETLNNLDEDETYYFKACAQNADNETDCGQVESFTTDDDNDGGNNGDIEVTTLSAQDVDENSAALRGDIEETNGEEVERWFEWGTDDDDLDETLSLSGSTDNEGTFEKTLSGLDEDETYYFRACIEEEDGNDEDCGIIKSFTTDDDNNNDNDNDSCEGVVDAITSSATGIGSSSAILNGVGTADDDYDYWFEWGSTTGMNSDTPMRSKSISNCNEDDTFHSESISGLTANRTYYFRMVVEDDDGDKEYGQMKSFKTSVANQTIFVSNPTSNGNTTIINNNDVSGAGELFIALDIESDFADAFAGSEIVFNVTYENIVKTDLEDVVLKVAFPEEIAFLQSTDGAYSDRDHSLVVDIGTLEEGEDGEVSIRGQLARTGFGNETLVTVAEITHKHPNVDNAQASATAYELTNIMDAASRLGASAFGSGMFFPGSVLGWLVFIALVLAIIFLARHLYAGTREKKAEQKDVKDAIRI